MVIVKNKNMLTEDTTRMATRAFIHLTGRKSGCSAEWRSKAGTTIGTADSHSICGVDGAYFYIQDARHSVFVNFLVAAMTSITRNHSDDGSPDEFTILLTDGTEIKLELL